MLEFYFRPITLVAGAQGKGEWVMRLLQKSRWKILKLNFSKDGGIKKINEVHSDEKCLRTE